MNQATLDMEIPTPTLEVVMKGIEALERDTDPKARIEVKMTLSEPEVKKLHAWMHSDTYEKAQALRKDDIKLWQDSLEYLVNYAMREYGSGSTVIAKVLVSLYNSRVVKVGLVDDLWSLDGVNFEHCMNVIRLCFETRQEPHSFFQNGGDLFQYIIKRHGLKKAGNV
jgi:hypothetical protein